MGRTCDDAGSSFYRLLKKEAIMHSLALSVLFWVFAACALFAKTPDKTYMGRELADVMGPAGLNLSIQV